MDSHMVADAGGVGNPNDDRGDDAKTIHGTQGDHGYVPLSHTNKKRREEVKRFLSGLKKECGGCGGVDDLTFHHTDPSEPHVNMSKVVRSRDMRMARAEVQKCIVLCRTCHDSIHEMGKGKR